MLNSIVKNIVLWSDFDKKHENKNRSNHTANLFKQKTYEDMELFI